jgi:hypothetical protein
MTLVFSGLGAGDEHRHAAGNCKVRRNSCEENYSSACEDRAKVNCGKHSRDFCEVIFKP